MQPTSDALVELAWSQSWQLAALALAVWLAVRLGCRRRPHLAYLLWMLVVVKALTPPLWSSPTGVFSWATTEVAEVALPERPMPAEEAREPEPPVSPRVPAAAADEPLPAPPPAAILPPRVPPMFSLPDAVIGLWGTGAVVLLAILIVRWMRLLRLLRATTQPVHQELERLFDILKQAIGPRRPVRLVCTSAAFGPAAIGWWRGTVILPSTLVREKTAAQLSQIIAHELVHLRRGDTLAGHVQLAAQIIWWFHPAVWWANRQARIERERACDEEVVAELGCRPAEYAALLVDVLKWRQRTPALLLPGIRASDVTAGRLHHLLNHAQPFRRRTPWATWLVALAALLIVVPGASLKFSIADEQPEASETESQANSGNQDRRPDARPADPAKGAAGEGDRETGRSIVGTGVNSNAGLAGSIATEEPPARRGEGQGGWVYEVDPAAQTSAGRGKEKVIAELRKLGLKVDFPQSTSANVTISFDYFTVTVPPSFRPTEKPLPLDELKEWNSIQIGGSWGGKTFPLTAAQLRQQIRAVRDLPARAPLWIGIDAANSEALDALAAIPQLESLMLWGRISERVLQPLENVKRLKSLSLHSMEAEQRDFDLAFVERTPELESFSGGSLSDAAMSRLGRLSKLRILSAEVRTVSGEGLQQLAASSSLESLHLSFSYGRGMLAPDDLAALAELENLQVLRIYATPLPGAEPLVATDASFAGWRKLAKLRTLSYEPCELSNAAMEEIGHLAELRELQLDGQLNVDDSGFLPIARLPNLTTLVLRSTHMTGATLAPLASAKTLNLLSMAGAPINDAGLAQIAQLSALKQLDLANTAITDQGLSQLRGKLPQLERLNVARTKLTDRGFEALLGRSRLGDLNACDTDLTAKLLGRMMTETTQGPWPRKIWVTELGDRYLPIQLP